MDHFELVEVASQGYGGEFALAVDDPVDWPVLFIDESLNFICLAFADSPEHLVPCACHPIVWKVAHGVPADVVEVIKYSVLYEHQT